MAQYALDMQLFRERLSEKVHAKIPKNVLWGGRLVLSSDCSLKKFTDRTWTYVCDYGKQQK